MKNSAWATRTKAVTVGIAIALASVMSVNWWSIYVQRMPRCHTDHCVADFLAIYAQALLIWENPTALYDAEQQAAVQKRLAPIERSLPSPYPPFAVLLHAPLALWSFSTAFLLFTAVNIALLVAVIGSLSRQLGLSADQRHWLVLFSLGNFAVQALLSNGQSSMILLFALTAHMLALRRGASLRAGIWAGLLCFKLQYLALPHFLLLIQRRWSAFGVGLAVAALLTAGPFLLLGSAALSQYLQILRLVGTENSWINPLESMHNLKALTGVWLPAPWHFVAWLVLVIAVLAALIWLNRAARRSDRGLAIAWIGNSLALLLLSPHLFSHDLSLLIIPCALLLSLSPAQVPPWLGLALVGVGLLPALNYLLPTLTAATLALLFALSLWCSRTMFQPAPA
jgi:hypothetical protein